MCAGVAVVRRTCFNRLSLTRVKNLADLFNLDAARLTRPLLTVAYTYKLQLLVSSY